MGLLGPDWRDYHAAIPRCNERSVASICVQPVRPMRRGVPGQDRYSETTVEAASGSDACSATGRVKWPRASGISRLGLDDDPSKNLSVVCKDGREIVSAASPNRSIAEMGQSTR